MRKILFRGKRVDNGEWIQGDFCNPCNIVFLENGYDPVLGKDDVPCCNDFEVIPETVGQYTGLTDRNGKKIFEGDVIKIKKWLYVVEWSSIGAFISHSYNPKAIFNGVLVSDWESPNIEFVGNIHDNPELLEVHNE